MRADNSHWAGPRGAGSAASKLAVAVIALALGLALPGGCASTPAGPSYLAVPASDYERAFTAAAVAARAEGLVPELADRESGRVETSAREAGSLIEPWTWGELTASDLVSGTLGFERRRAHFEFVPVGFTPAMRSGDAPLAGPILPGSEREADGGLSRALSTPDAGLEVRVTVSVERRFRPGYQGNAYTRALGSFSQDLEAPADGPEAARDRSVWTPVARDERLERVLLGRIAEALDSGASATRSADR